MSTPDSAVGAGLRLFLLGGMRIDLGVDRLQPPPSIGRTIAYVALSAPEPVSRPRLARQLWVDHSDERASANLRSALWRCRRFAPRLLVTTLSTVSLHAEVWLDVHHLSEVIGSRPTGRLGQDGDALLLPGWNDDWVLFERERLRHRLIRHLEEECERCLAKGDHERAYDLALQAMSFEPLREHPHRLIVEAHLGRGDVFEAIRAFEHFEILLERELGLPPSPALSGLIRRVSAGAHRLRH